MAFGKVAPKATTFISQGWDAFNTLIDDIKSVANGKGASQVGIEDTAGNMTATNVEDALAEIYSDTATTVTLAETFAENSATTTGLTWGYKGGLFRLDAIVTDVAAGTIGLTDDATNYIEIIPSTGAVAKNTTSFTSGRIPIRQVTTVSGAQTVSTDKRAWFSQVAAATLITSGIVELATDAEAIAGSDTGRCITPSNINAVISNIGAIKGLVISNDTDTEHDILFGTGICSDSSGSKLLTLSSAMAKQIDAIWAVGDDAGGIFDGSVAADTTYHCFIIEKDSDGSIDAGFDTSITASNIPTGYISYRRVGSVTTDSSSNIINFTAIEIAGGSLDVSYNAMVQDLSDATPGTSRVAIALTIPADIQAIARVNTRYNYTSGTGYVWFRPTTFTDSVPSATNYTHVAISSHTRPTLDMEILTDATSQIAFRVSIDSNIVINTLGYTDRRI